MAITRYRLTAPVTLGPGAFTAGLFSTGNATVYGTGSYAPGAGNWGSGGPVTFPKGQLIQADSASPLVTAIGAGNLAAVTPAQETGGFYGTAN